MLRCCTIGSIQNFREDTFSISCEKKDSKTRVKTIFRAFTGLKVTKLREMAERTTFQREEGSISPLSSPLGMAHASFCNKEVEGRITLPSKEKQDSRLPVITETKEQSTPTQI